MMARDSENRPARSRAVRRHCSAAVSPSGRRAQRRPGCIPERELPQRTPTPVVRRRLLLDDGEWGRCKGSNARGQLPGMASVYVKRAAVSRPISVNVPEPRREA